MLLPHSQKSSALKTLTPFLHDDAVTTPSIRPQVEQAIDECDAQLTPVPAERLKQVMARLMLHFGYDGAKARTLCADYSGMLQHYPEDLLCAAYLHVLKHYSALPPASEFIAFMEPEMRYRKTVRRRLETLLEETEAAV